MKNLVYKLGISLIIIFSAIGISLTQPQIKKLCYSSEYKKYNSPYNNYHITVYTYSVPYLIMPGGSGDVPGYIRLYNKNKAIKEKEIDMLQLINEDSIKWTKTQVSIKFIGTWDLK